MQEAAEGYTAAINNAYQNYADCTQSAERNRDQELEPLLEAYAECVYLVGWSYSYICDWIYGYDIDMAYSWYYMAISNCSDQYAYSYNQAWENLLLQQSLCQPDDPPSDGIYLAGKPSSLRSVLPIAQDFNILRVGAP